MALNEDVYTKLGGSTPHWPVFDSKPAFTRDGNPYFQQPGVVLLAKPMFDPVQLSSFLDGFDESLEFGEYVEDPEILGEHDACEGTMLIKAAGQLCYMSFGPGRTKNADAQKYVDNILSSGHGSVLEHAQYTWLIWGADRAFTHELVRHRTGVAFSQVSQRYVDGKVLRFVERPEWQRSPKLHEKFLARMVRSAVYAVKDFFGRASLKRVLDTKFRLA
jgi:thymidylate synthase (FAD)